MGKKSEDQPPLFYRRDHQAERKYVCLCMCAHDTVCVHAYTTHAWIFMSIHACKDVCICMDSSNTYKR